MTIRLITGTLAAVMSLMHGDHQCSSPSEVASPSPTKAHGLPSHLNVRSIIDWTAPHNRTMSFLSNLILFSPLLAIALLVLTVLDRAETLRKGAILKGKEKQAEPDQEPDDGDDDDNNTDGGPPSDAENDDDGNQHGASDGHYDDSVDIDEDEDDEEVGDDFEFIDHPDPSLPTAQGPAGETDDTDAAAAGPANAPSNATQPALHIPQTRIIGKKKAASLARRDQRRAYHEFIQSQAQAEAAKNRALEEEISETLFEERRRRALAEEEIAARKAEEKRIRIEKEKAEAAAKGWGRAELDLLRKEVGSGEVCGMWKLSELGCGRGEKWVAEGLEREGLLGIKHTGDNSDSGWKLRTITAKGWYVVLGDQEIEQLWGKLDEAGEKGLKWSEIGSGLEQIVLAAQG